MNTRAITTIFSIDSVVQKLNASNGPVSLVVLYVQLKKLTSGRLQTDITTHSVTHLYEQLSQAEISALLNALLDYYKQNQTQAYQATFCRIQEHIHKAIDQLPLDEYYRSVDAVDSNQ